MKISVTSNFADLAKQITALGSQAKFVSAVSLTRTAQDMRTALKQEMPRAFDRPTTYTLNSLFVKGATKTNLEARVWVKDSVFGKGTPAIRYLGPQIYSGPREHKGMEKALASAGLMAKGDYAVPAAGAQMDSYGNVKRSQVVQIMSQLKLQQRGGYESRASKSAASKRTVKRQGVTYFAIAKSVGSLMPGIYLKRIASGGRSITPVFIFTRSPRYKSRFKFFEVGMRVAQQRFPAHFNQEMEKAIKTAFPRTQLSLF